MQFTAWGRSKDFSMLSGLNDALPLREAPPRLPPPVFRAPRIEAMTSNEKAIRTEASDAALMRKLGYGIAGLAVALFALAFIIPGAWPWISAAGIVATMFSLTEFIFSSPPEEPDDSVATLIP